MTFRRLPAVLRRLPQIPAQRRPLPDDGLVRVTCVQDELAHLVAEDELAAPGPVDAGRFRAVCGHLIAPAPLVQPDGSRCPACYSIGRS